MSSWARFFDRFSWKRTASGLRPRPERNFDNEKCTRKSIRCSGFTMLIRCGLWFKPESSAAKKFCAFAGVANVLPTNAIRYNLFETFCDWLNNSIICSFFAIRQTLVCKSRRLMGPPVCRSLVYLSLFMFRAYIWFKNTHIVEVKKPGMSQAIDNACPRNGRVCEAAAGNLLQFRGFMIREKAQKRMKNGIKKTKSDWMKILTAVEFPEIKPRFCSWPWISCSKSWCGRALMVYLYSILEA